MGIAHWDDVERHRRAKGEMDATWQRLGKAAGTKGVGAEPRARRARQAADSSPLARRVGGDLLRAGRLRARLAGRAGARSAPRRLRHPPRRRARAHLRGRSGRARVPRLRHEPPNASSAGCLARAQCGSAGPGSRGGPTTRGTAKPRRRRSATASPPSGRRTSSTSTRSSTGQRGSATTAPTRHDRALRPGGLPLGAARSRRARLGAALPFRGRGGLRHPRGRRDARTLALAGRGGGPCRRA